MIEYCCYGAYAEVGCLEDCPSKKAAPVVQPAPAAQIAPVAWRWSPTHYAHLPGLRKDWQEMPPPDGHRAPGEIDYAYLGPAP